MPAVRLSDRDLLAELEPVADAQLRRHEQIADEWFPHDYIPYSMGRDFDKDGWVDVLVLRGGWMGPKDCFPNSLLRNNGDGTFAEVTAQTGLPATYSAWALTAAFVDADHDGDLDIFVGNFADLTKWPGSSETAIFPNDFAGTPNRLFRNNGAVDGKTTFTEITEQAGLSGGALKTAATLRRSGGRVWKPMRCGSPRTRARGTNCRIGLSSFRRRGARLRARRRGLSQGHARPRRAVDLHGALRRRARPARHGRRSSA